MGLFFTVIGVLKCDPHHQQGLGFLFKMDGFRVSPIIMA